MFVGEVCLPRFQGMQTVTELEVEKETRLQADGHRDEKRYNILVIIRSPACCEKN